MSAIAKEILIETRKLLANPVHWTQRATARDATGNRVDSISSQAYCWCLTGAMHKAATENFHVEMPDVADRQFEAIKIFTKANNGYQGGWHDVALWNDAYDREHFEVLKALDRAIKAVTDDKH